MAGRDSPHRGLGKGEVEAPNPSPPRSGDFSKACQAPWAAMSQVLEMSRPMRAKAIEITPKKFTAEDQSSGEYRS
jgi:hypothetical protein